MEPKEGQDAVLNLILVSKMFEVSGSQMNPELLVRTLLRNNWQYFRRLRKGLKLIILAVLVTFATAAFMFCIGIAIAIASMVIFKVFGKSLSPVKSWNIGALTVALMTLALVFRSHSDWGYAADAAEILEGIFGAVACLVLVLIGLSQAGVTQLIRLGTRSKE